MFQKKGSRDEAVEIPRYFSRLRRQISLAYITTAPPPNLTRPATQATRIQASTSWLNAIYSCRSS